MSTNEQRGELIAQLRLRQASQDIRLVLQLVDLLFEDTKNRMITAAPETLLGLQFEARAYQKLRKDLTRAPHETSNKD